MEGGEQEFDKIIDPETNMNVPVESKVGQQVIKNYLECLKNGPDSDKIVSTKMYYRPKKSSSSKSQTGSSSKSQTGSSSKSQTGSSSNLGSVKGTCKKCNQNVYSTQERVKSSGSYYHDTCFKK
jgi:hypothetical protein